MIKAFLSHSSKDKEFVRAVAKLLGRQLCIFDEQVFSTGEEFKSSIEKGLDDSSVFVLFASQHAIDSIWVQFELEETWFHRLHNTLKKTRVLVYIIDSAIGVENLPNWLHRALIRREISPKVVARDIQYHLDELLRERQHPFFVGRSKEHEELEQVLIPVDGTSPPRAVFVMGLPGVGRRSLVREAVPSLLNLKKNVEIQIREGDSTHDICISVANRVEPYSTEEGLAQIIQDVRSLPEQEASKRTLKNLRKMADVGELPIFFDQGGLLDSDGWVRKPIQDLLREFAPNDTAYMFLISNRRPRASFDLSIPVVFVGPLKENEIKRLISKLADQNNLKISPGKVAELSEYVAGYPPSAHLAIQQVKKYGIDMVMSLKAHLVQFRTSVFLQYLEKLELGSEAQSLLRLLAGYSPLPLAVIGRVLGTEPEIIQEVVIQLIDLALITVTDDGYYAITDPITGAAENAFGFSSTQEHEDIARSLADFLRIENQASDHPRLELSRVLFRAAHLAKDDEIARKTFHFASDLINLTETLYHARRYEEAITMGKAALEERPESETARSYLIRAFIQKEKWKEASDEIEILRNYAPSREIYYLIGLLERKQRHISEAIAAYQEARKLGKKGTGINRELAYCYYQAGDFEKASNYIEEALKRNRDNKYIVDLQVQIATAQRNTTTANEALQHLKLVGDNFYYHHRASRVALAFGDLIKARDEAKLAISLCENNPPFEVLAQLAYCELEQNDLHTADKSLAELDRQFKDTHSDIRTGLRCKLEMARKNYKKALTLAEHIKEKNTVSYKKLRHETLLGEIHNSALSDIVRIAYENELSRLREDLKDARPEQFIPTDFDSY